MTNKSNRNFFSTLQAGLLAVVAVVGLFIAAPAEAQTYGVNAIVPGGTNNVGNTNTSTYNAVIDCTQRANVALEFKFSLTSTGTSNVIFTLVDSLDGVTASTTQPRTITVAANGTNVVDVITNVTVNAIGSLILTTVQNTNSVPVTNLTVNAALKPGRALY